MKKSYNIRVMEPEIGFIEKRRRFLRDYAFYHELNDSKISRIAYVVSFFTLLFTFGVFGAYLSVFKFSIENEFLNRLIALNGVGIYIFFTCNFLYVAIYPIPGISFIPIAIALYFLANIFRFYVWHAWAICLVFDVMCIMFHVITYFIQKRGHFETYISALFLTPLFVCMDILFLCGWNKKLRQDIGYTRQYVMLDQNDNIENV